MSDEKKPVPEYLYGKYSNYQREQTNKYNKENYKTVTIRFRAHNGYCPEREIIQAAAELSGESLNSFCTRILTEYAREIIEQSEKTELTNES